MQATVAGKTQRVAELQEVLDEIEADVAHSIGDQVLTKMPPIDQDRKCHSTDFYLHEAWPEAGGVHITGDGTERSVEAKIRLDGVDLVTPRGDAIATAVSCEITQDKALMVTGRNATGKTSFVRVVAGLWPHAEGKLEVPCPAGSSSPGLKNVFIVPQRIHMAIGSLADQVTYPLKIPVAERTEAKEAELMGLLDQVGIGYLVSRWAGDADDVVSKDHKGWDHVTRWCVRTRTALLQPCVHATGCLTACAPSDQVLRPLCFCSPLCFPLLCCCDAPGRMCSRSGSNSASRWRGASTTARSSRCSTSVQARSASTWKSGCTSRRSATASPASRCRSGCRCLSFMRRSC
jgi:energy-coupling factor transporter ATP-binding protein EcfA2